MKRITFLFLVFSLTARIVNGQNCNCEETFKWVKNTFEENDAGFQYVIEKKGQDAYAYHNQSLLPKIKEAKTYNECRGVIREWLNFFRRFHLSISLTDSIQKMEDSIQKVQTQKIFKNIDPNVIANHEKFIISDKEWNAYVSNIKKPGFEGIWSSPPYTIGIIKKGDVYVGFVIDAPGTPMQKGHIKLKIYRTPNGFRGTTFTGDFQRRDSTPVSTFGNRFLSVGAYSLERVAPKFEETKETARYFKYVFSTSPYIEKLSDNTVYLRLPSFNISQKKSIDSLINANHNLITSTPNLIIDVRNNGGGSDASYDELIQYLYTNPIRYIGVQSYSTKLNNQRFLTYTKNMNFSEEDRKEFFERYKKLNQHLGEFVTDDSVSISILKKIYSYPKNVGILINRGTGSSAEQFLIDAMQSKKVKLFGTSTLGSLDMSNINSVISPNNDFILSYSTTKSLRLPEFVVDASGIQPNYYIDNSIPEEKWIEFVTKILEE